MKGDFARLPLENQCRELERALADGRPLDDLLGLCAALSDPTPLAWLCARPGLLQNHTELLAQRFGEWPETSLLKVLKNLPPEPALERILRGALERLGLGRLAVLAMLERSLKQLFPDSYEEYLQEIEARLPCDRSLALLPARALNKLTDQQKQRRAELAGQALEQLSRAPKAVSLSNAEELLSKRVYTQPGHFFFELLQNAEDAQARTFKVKFEPDKIVVWHDGLPFDVRDLVGVTSIGQTTKKKQQIGFFGVGFKSVYEVTDRPQIYSDVFCFEIIDVSIPRALTRPPEVTESGTTLILPLKKPSPELPGIIRQLDPGVLLTLTHLKEIDLGDGHNLKRQDDRINDQSYWLDVSDHRYDGPERESGRPDSTRIIVAVLTQDGKAVPPAETAPTIYSYLPTSQPSGLRFLVHSHFDVPVDRERINPESAWNRWIIQQLPQALARLAATHDLLEILPLPGEPSGPFSNLPQALKQNLQSVACLPENRRPADVKLSTPEIADLGLPLQLWAPTGRAHQVAEQTLGCPTFDIAELVDYLVDHPPPANIEALYAVLGPQLDVYKDWLRRLKIVPDAAGQLNSAERLHLAGPELRPLYPPDQLVKLELDDHPFLQRLQVKRLQAEDLVQYLEQNPNVSDPDLALRALANASTAVKERAAQLPLFLATDGRRYPLARMGSWQGVARVAHPSLAQFYEGKRPLLATDYPDWPILELDWASLALDLLEQRLREIPHDLLEEGFRHIPEVLLQRLAALPLWPDRPLTTSLRAAHPELITLFPKKHFLPDELAVRAHVQALLPNPVGVDLVLDELDQVSNREAALDLVVRHANEVSTGAAQRMWSRAQLPDDQGRNVPLTQLWRAESKELKDLYGPGGLRRHFVGPTAERLLARLSLLEKLPVAGLRELIEDLAQASGPLNTRSILAFLASRAGELWRNEAQRCLSLPLFPDRPLGGPKLERDARAVWCVEPSLQPLMQKAGWPLLDAELEPYVDELMASALRQRVSIRDLLELGGPPPEGLLPCLTEHRQALKGFGPLADLPIWPTLAGTYLPARAVGHLLPDVYNEPEITLTPEAWQCLLQLAPQLLPMAALDHLRQRVREQAKDGQRLSAQPAFLNTAERVRAVAEHLDGTPLVDGNGCLRTARLLACDELTRALLPPEALQEISILDVGSLKPIPPLRVLEALKTADWRRDATSRKRLYDWLLQRENEVFSCGESRRLLSEKPLWLTLGGRLLPAKELVLEDGVPDLGVDWYPHEEIPSALKEVLRRQLGVGRLRPLEFLQSHLLPAYRQAVGTGQRARADALFAYLAEQLQDQPQSLGKDFPVRDRAGRYRPASEVAWPDPEMGLDALVRDYLLAEDYSPNEVRFLRSLGLAELPPWNTLQAIFDQPRRLSTAQSLARLLAALYRRRGDSVLENLPFRTQNWMADALGAPRRAHELFLPLGEIEALIGSHGRLYPDPTVADLLGEELMRKLNLRERVAIDDVLANLKTCSQAGQAVSFRVYQWLESQLNNDLKTKLANLNWVYSDDGLWFNHKRVLGTHAFTLFGNRRGYWERGRISCPGLCRLFEIPTEVTPDVVRGFLEEVAMEVKRLGDREVLKQDKALARMLPACYTHLSSLGPSPIDRRLPVILAQSRPGKERRLLPADHAALVSSDTPSLEQLFESAGTFFVALTGTLEQRTAVEAFHEAMGLRNLREAFAITQDSGGVDRTADCAAGVGRLRGALRALLAVLPRIRRQRDQLSRQGWLDQQRLRPLSQSGTIRVIEGLKVVYQLPGVGSARVDVPGAYNPARGELLVDYALAARPDAPLTGLAQGLVPCIYQGPGEEQLVDILEILLPLNTRERMDAYLDARHFPTDRGPERSAEDRLGERLGELLDYGWEQRLAQQFPQLKDLSSWREADALAGCQSPEQATAQLLKRAGCEQPDEELRKAVLELLTAGNLDRLRAPAATPPPPPRPTLVEVVEEDDEPMVVEEAGNPPAEGLLMRVRNWLWGSPAVQEAVASVLPVWARGGNPYEPRSDVHTQFWGTRQRMEEISNRPPASGLYHQPGELPRPYQYAAHALCGTFDPGAQRWLTVPGSELKNFHVGQPTGRLIPFQGTLQPGVSRLPIPFYTRLHGELQLSCKGKVQLGHYGEVTVQFSGPTQANTRFSVEILAPPRLSGQSVKVPDSWLRPTYELPPEVHRWMTTVRSLSPWERALAAQEFVTLHYAYDPDYLEHPLARQVLNNLPRGQSNHHLELLHARRQGDQLGHGICYELNVMLCELLRQLGVPALLATGWVLDEGFLEHPDHMFAVAVLGSQHGPCLMPLDSAYSTRGALRPLGRRRPPGNVLAEVPSLAAPAGAWNPGGSLRNVDGTEDLRTQEERLRQRELSLHVQALKMLKVAVPEGDDLAHFQQALRARLPSPEVAYALIRLLSGDYQSLTTLPGPVEELVRMGLAEVQTVPTLRVKPKT